MKPTKSRFAFLTVAAGLFAGGSIPLHAQTPTGGAGTRPVALLLCQYADKPETYGFTPAGILGHWVGNTYSLNGSVVDNSINGLVQDASFGKLSFQGTQAFGWFKLTNPLSSYAKGSAAGNDCIEVAQRNGVDLRPFTYVTVYMNDVLPDANGVTWRATLPGPPSPTVWNAMVVDHRVLTSPPFMMHEIGHLLSNAGAHSNSFTNPMGGGARYGDDPKRPKPNVPLRSVLVAPEWDAAHRELMGFIPASSIATFAGGTQTYNISRLTQPLPGLLTVIDVPLPGGAKYVISARTRIGYDAFPLYPAPWDWLFNSVATEGVRIELFKSPDLDIRLQMSRSGTDIDPESTDAVWLTGQSFTDAANGITITVANFNPTGNPTAQIIVTSGLSGNYRLNAQNAPGMCLDVNASGGSGSQVQIWGCHGGNNQSFNFVAQGNGFYQIQPSYNSGLCLDVYNAGTSPGTSVGLWSCNGGSHQKWSIVGGGANVYELAPQHAPQLRLDVYNNGTSNGTQTVVWTANGANNQKWALIK